MNLDPPAKSVPHPAPGGANERCVMSALTDILYEIAPCTASVVTMWPFGQTATVRPCACCRYLPSAAAGVSLAW
jgi:hypothetical protein